MALSASTHFGAWLKYGKPPTEAQLNFAIKNYRVAVLQPWEHRSAQILRAARPDMVLLFYKCLSSVRSYEPGPIFSSGVDYHEAEEAGEHWFAHRSDGGPRIEWRGYPGHWQMATWENDYRQRWCDNVCAELKGSVWDGVMADNDVYDDYYGLHVPLEGGRVMSDLRAALDLCIAGAGAQLNDMGKILVPNIAESRRDPGRWSKHAAFGGGLEEVYLAWGPGDYLGPAAAAAQAPQVAGPGLTILRTATDGDNEHPNFIYGLAAFWIFGGGSGGAFTATAHDGYDGTPFIPQLNWNLGDPLEPPQRRGNSYSRRFTDGWAAVNFNTKKRRRVSYAVPAGLLDAAGAPAPDKVTLQPHEGILYLRG